MGTAALGTHPIGIHTRFILILFYLQTFMSELHFQHDRGIFFQFASFILCFFVFENKELVRRIPTVTGKPRKTWKAFSSQGKSQGILNRLEMSGKIRKKYWKKDKITDKYYMIF